jgi:hypothetical protein
VRPWRAAAERLADDRTVAAQRRAGDGALTGKRRLGVERDSRRELAARDGRTAEDLAQGAEPLKRAASGRSKEHRDDGSRNQDGDQRRAIDLSPPRADQAHFSRG